nr:putative reverse transcriptase domain-containing protein [Tanacetum cinerariifolium]
MARIMTITRSGMTLEAIDELISRALMDIPPNALDVNYTVELADGRIAESDTIIRGCPLILLDHPLSTDLMPIKLGSFDVVIRMDWLARYHAVIICDKKIVRIPYGNDILTIRGDGSSEGSNSRLSIISCTKTQKVREEDIPKTAFSTRYGHYEFQVMPFELTNTPVVFIDLMYRVQFLRHVIDSKGVHVDPAKIETIKDWATPKTPIEIRQVLGLVGYYQMFIEGFSKIARPMTKLTQNAPILALPEGSENFMGYSDASHKGLGLVVMHKEKVIAYASCQPKVHEKNYTTHDLELGFVVFALKMWRHYLYGTKYVVFTDHKSLQHILDQKELNMRHRRWLELVSDYDCEIRYHPEKVNVVADALSQNERVKPLRVPALMMTIDLNLPSQILSAQSEARKEENYAT